MKTITLYQCEICGQKHDTQERAMKCEARGRPPGDAIPLGTILNDTADYLRHGDLGLLQVLCKGDPPSGPWSRHYTDACYHTFRDWKDGRRYGDDSPQSGGMTTGPALTSDLLSRTVEVDTSTPRYRRAFESYREAGLPLFVLVEGRPVPAPEPTDDTGDAP